MGSFLEDGTPICECNSCEYRHRKTDGNCKECLGIRKPELHQSVIIVNGIKFIRKFSYEYLHFKPKDVFLIEIEERNFLKEEDFEI